jgi:hypothetical protein
MLMPMPIRPVPSKEEIEEQLRLPPPDFTKLPINADMEAASEFFRLYRSHMELLASHGLSGQFMAVLLFNQAVAKLLFSRIAAVAYFAILAGFAGSRVRGARMP